MCLCGCVYIEELGDLQSWQKVFVREFESVREIVCVYIEDLGDLQVVDKREGVRARASERASEREREREEEYMEALGDLKVGDG